MTFGEMHDLVDVLLDKHDLPWFNPGEKDLFLNLAQMEYVKENYSAFEANEKTKQNIANLTRSVRINGPTSVFMISTLPGFMFFVRVVGLFSDTKCNRSTKDRKWSHDENAANLPVDTDSLHALKSTRNSLTVLDVDTTLTDTISRSIQPTQLDDIESSFGDPFNEPTDEHPRYVVLSDPKGDGYVRIYSESDPLFVDVDYLSKPKNIDGENDPSGLPSLLEYTHEEIVNIAVRKMLENIESQRYNSQRAEIQEQIK